MHRSLEARAPVLSGDVMRLVVATTLDLSLVNGPSDHVLAIISRLSRLGYQITTLSPRPSLPIKRELPASTRLCHYPSLARFGLPNAFSGILAIPQLARLRDHELLYVRNSPGTLPITAAGKRLGFRRIIVEHNGWLATEIGTYGYWRRLSRLAEWCQVKDSKLASANRVVTPELKARLLERGVPADRVHVIENGSDTETIRPACRAECRRALGLPEDGRPILAFVGNLWEGAGMETVLDALQRSELGLERVLLLIVGDGQSRLALESKVSSLPLGRVDARFLGSLPPEMIAVALGASDVALAPYRIDHTRDAGLSALKLRTYAAAGKPTVISSLPSLSSLGQETWIFAAEPDNAASFAGAIGAALAADRDQMCISARRFAEANDWSVAVGRINSLLRNEGVELQARP